MDSKARSIAQVQEAEEKAGLIVQEANKAKDAAIRDAEEKAREIAENAVEAASKAGEGVLERNEKDLANVKRKLLADAHRKAAKVRKSKIGVKRLEALAEKAAKEIMG